MAKDILLDSWGRCPHALQRLYVSTSTSTPFQASILEDYPSDSPAPTNCPFSAQVDGNAAQAQAGGQDKEDEVRRQFSHLRLVQFCRLWSSGMLGARGSSAALLTGGVTKLCCGVPRSLVLPSN